MRFVLGPDKVYCFFILMPFSYLNFKKIGLGGKELFRIMNPGTVTVRRISRNACCKLRLPVAANVVVRGNTVRVCIR
jgi:hypothetical protein